MKIRLFPLALIALLASPVHALDGASDPASGESQVDEPRETGADGGASDADNHPEVPLTRGLAGPYLAGRAAAIGNDFDTAAKYYLRALGQDGTDPYLQDSALVSLISAGRTDEAVTLARRVIAQEDATDLAGLVHMAALAQEEKWDELLASLDEQAQPAPSSDLDHTEPEQLDPAPANNGLLDGLLEAWALLGSGRASDSVAAFEELAQIPGARPMVQYHLALAKARVGDYEAADQLLGDRAASGHVLGVTAHAQVLSQLEQNTAAVTLLEAFPGFTEEPGLVALRDRLVAGETLPFDAINSATEGMAQVFLTFSTALASAEDPDPLALIQARLAEYLAPDLAEARLFTAQLLQSFGQYDLAEREFDRLREDSGIRPITELARIDTLARAERLDAAEKAALTLTASYPDMPQGWIALGDLLRQQDKFAQAVPAYDKALSLLSDAGNTRWFALYARGIALERSDQFSRAEQDFRAALEIQPDSAQVLNYLGYSLVDRNERLDEALPMIERAVELRPDDGYILDSLAWAYYQLGRFADAVTPMERSVSLMPDDPLVNDHMGDIYWMVGRKREAEIQWQRALSLDPETEAEERRIRSKLERGLDAVLSKETDANPTGVSDRDAN